LSRVTLETANPRDVLALCASLNRIPRTKNRIELDLERVKPVRLRSALFNLCDVLLGIAAEGFSDRPVPYRRRAGSPAIGQRERRLGDHGFFRCARGGRSFRPAAHSVLPGRAVGQPGQRDC